MKDTEIRQQVREGYGKIAKEAGGSCCGQQNNTTGCRNTNPAASAREASKSIGYSDADLESVPEGANLGLGCGNPIALASLKEGETVLDLGSGAGFDCFLAAQRVGKKGKVIGVDMTPEMLEKARENARKDNYTNVEFRMGEIENLPAADDTADIIISNCVINLSTDKPRVFREAFRVLKPGGRLMVSDIVLEKELPEIIKNSVQAYLGCVAGALPEADYLGAIEKAGFKDVTIKGKTVITVETMIGDPIVESIAKDTGLNRDQLAKLAVPIKSIKVGAVKPK